MPEPVRRLASRYHPWRGVPETCEPQAGVPSRAKPCGRKRIGTWEGNRALPASIGQARSGRPPVVSRLLEAASRLPDLVDGVDPRQQLPGGGKVERLLDLAGLLRRLPEVVVQVRVFLEVLGLEVVVPQDVEVVLDEFGALLLDVDAARLEQDVVAGLVQPNDLVAGLGLDARLLGVVDPAGNVAVRIHDAGRAQDGAQGEHRVSFSSG